MKFPIYEVLINDDVLGLTAVSFVDRPAIEQDFLAFSEKKLMFASDEKREIVSPILIPNQLILRVDEDGQFYYIKWSEEVIKQAFDKYMKNGYFNNFTVMHPDFEKMGVSYDDVLEDGVKTLEAWIIEDAETDKANVEYGFDLPVGTLMVHLKVENNSIWERVKSGELKGLSIEAFTEIEMINQNKVLKQNKEMKQFNISLFRKFVMFLNEVSEEADKISDILEADKTESAEIEAKFYIDNKHYLYIDAEGYVRDEESNLVDTGEYKLDDGNILVVDEDNKFVETKSFAEEESDKIEAPIAESKVEPSEEDKEDKEEEKEDESEKEDEELEAEDADKTVGLAPEEDGENIVEDGKEEEVPYIIDDVEYMLPKAVVDFIDSLVEANAEANDKMDVIMEKMSSATPIPTVPVENKKDEKAILFDAIRRLNR